MKIGNFVPGVTVDNRPDWLKKLRCRFGKHARKYWSKETCDRENVMSGIFAPWECAHCNHKSQVFPKLDPIDAAERLVDRLESYDHTP